MKRIILAAALLAALTAPAQSATLEEVVKVAVGVNGVWFDGANAAFPSDIEAGAAGRASLSPHISVVGGAFYGFDHSYFRGSVGPRVTISDVENRDFSMGLGIQYEWASEASVRPNEWAPAAAVGFRPWPLQAPKIIVGGDASYGLTSNKVRATIAVRYALDLF